MNPVGRDAEARPDGRPVPRSGGISLSRYLESALGVPFEPGNRVDVLRNGDEIFPAMLGAIERATRTVDLLTFVYWEGDIAVRVAEALAARAEAGVRVRVLLDGVGAAQIDKKLVRQMRDRGATVAFFRRPTSWRIWRASHRTHRKVLICDGEIAFTGGVGIADEWVGDARHPGEWRETHLRLAGPALAGLEAAFLGNWVECCREPRDLLRPVVRRTAGDARIMTVRSTASVGWSDVATLVWTLFAGAKERIRIATAYFVPDDRTVQLLCERAREGLRVEVLVPGPHIDERLCDLAHGPDVAPLLEAGVTIYRYQPTMLHTKVIIADDLAAVGSPNLNHRSMQQDDECCVVIDHTPTVAHLNRQRAPNERRSKNGRSDPGSAGLSSGSLGPSEPSSKSEYRLRRRCAHRARQLS